jgi:hypothetical protein
MIATLALMLLSLLSRTQARAAAVPKIIALSVEASGALPGFRIADASSYLAAEMAKAHLDGWDFVPSAPAAAPAADRVEWRFRLNPYAGGSVRQIIPIPALSRVFGIHRLLTAELRLYLGGDYQTMSFGEATIQGGADDKELAAFITKLTENLLGAHGAYRSIDTAGSPSHGNATPR